MSFSAIGIEYSGMIGGQTITETAATTVLKTHYVMLRYAPLPYLLLSAGTGATKYSTDEYDSARFTETPGASASFGLQGFTPRMFNLLMITAGAHTYLLNSKFGWHRYIGTLIDPGAGAVFVIADRFDIETGVKAFVLFGRKEATYHVTDFSNENIMRWYLSLTLHSPVEGAYCSITADLSPNSSIESNGLREASLSLRIGAIIRPFRNIAFRNEIKKNIDSFRSYGTMKLQQEKMAENLKKGNW